MVHDTQKTDLADDLPQITGQAMDAREIAIGKCRQIERRQVPVGHAADELLEFRALDFGGLAHGKIMPVFCSISK